MMGFLIVLALLILFVWLGLSVKPADFPRLQSGATEDNSLTLPDTLPPPVARFYARVAELPVPILRTWAVSGQAILRFGGIPFPARFRFIHRAGRDYAHIMDATIFGWPLLKGFETFIGGKGRLVLPFGVSENSNKINQASNLSLWAESIFLPTVLAAHPGVRWEPVDESTARLFVPFGTGEDRLTVSFDADSGLICAVDAMRYRDESDNKIPWHGEYSDWKVLDSALMPTMWAIRWMDQKQPWSTWTIHEFMPNIDDSLISMSGRER